MEVIGNGGTSFSVTLQATDESASTWIPEFNFQMIISPFNEADITVLLKIYKYLCSFSIVDKKYKYTTCEVSVREKKICTILVIENWSSVII